MKERKTPKPADKEKCHKDKYRIEGRTLIIALEEQSIDRIREYLKKMKGMKENIEIDMDAIPLPGFEDAGIRPWIYFHLLHDETGTYLRCELYTDWNSCEYDAVNCTDGPAQLFNWRPEFPEDFPIDTLTFEPAEEGLVLSLPEDGPAHERLFLKDTPMVWRIRSLVRDQSAEKDEKQDLLQEMEECRASLAAVYPEAAIGDSFEKCLDGNIRASVYTENFKFCFSCNHKGEKWERISYCLFRGTAVQLKERLTELAKNTVSRYGTEGLLTATSSVSELERDCFGNYISCVKYHDSRSAVYAADLFYKDWDRYKIFDLDGMIKEEKKEHPDLPIVLVYEGKVINDCSINCYASEFLDYDYFRNEKAFTNRKDFKESLEDHFSRKFGKGTEKAQEACREAVKEMEPYWTDAVLINVN